LKEQGNILRLIVGHSDPIAMADRVEVLETNLDDTSGEVIGHTVQTLLDAGALDVYLTPIQMKKNRPATKLTVLCSADLRRQMEAILFRETTTLGIRHWSAARSTLRREQTCVNTPWGEVKGKRITNIDGSIQFSPEYEECARVAGEQDVSLRDVMQAARGSFTP
jgi:uncharacterized protein (DUF111 family)